MNYPTPTPRSSLIAGILFLILLTACSPPSERTLQSDHPWANALRALNPADATTPAYDLTAVYLRANDENLQIRIDLLDFHSSKELSLDIRIEDASAPDAVPLEIHLPTEGDSTRISIDPQLATAILEIPLSEIPSDSRVDVSTPEDEITGLTLDGPVPTQYAPLLLTFHEAFTGRFPAEALRAWDGAHSGPRGERHGLKHLLDAAEEYQVPIVLLDLKEPANLSALDAMGVLPRIRRMEQAGLLILPDQPEQEVLFEFSSSPFAWGTLTSRSTFVLSSDLSHIYRPLFSNTRLIPIAAGAEATQPTSEGPSLEVRRALLDTALNTDEKDLLVLGGNLRFTTWGSPDMAGPTLAYFASRPYIHSLSADDLMDFSTKSDEPEVLPANLSESIPNLKFQYENLTRPVLDFAKNWDGSPLSQCETDLDKDGGLECILADENYLAILDPQGARLTYLFTREGENLHQLIGPSWQVAVGLSDPSTWDLSAGEAADPGAYPGAFADVDDPFKPYETAIEGSTFTFTSLDGTRVKTFKLTKTGLEVEYQTEETMTTQISLLVDPDTRFTPGWAEKYTQQNTPGGITWGLENGLMVSVQAEGAVTMRAFNESLSLLSIPEDPDFDYPPGHYVPFPMAIAEVEMGDGYFLRLERLP
ncbi:MAG: hypothetical protein WBL25_19150 [Anaerolineales bacterium]